MTTLLEHSEEYSQLRVVVEACPNTPREAGPWITQKCQVGQVFSLGLQ